MPLDKFEQATHKQNLKSFTHSFVFNIEQEINHAIVTFRSWKWNTIMWKKLPTQRFKVEAYDFAELVQQPFYKETSEEECRDLVDRWAIRRSEDKVIIHRDESKEALVLTAINGDLKVILKHFLDISYDLLNGTASTDNPIEMALIELFKMEFFQGFEYLNQLHFIAELLYYSWPTILQECREGLADFENKLSLLYHYKDKFKYIFSHEDRPQAFSVKDLVNLIEEKIVYVLHNPKIVLNQIIAFEQDQAHGVVNKLEDLAISDMEEAIRGKEKEIAAREFFGNKILAPDEIQNFGEQILNLSDKDKYSLQRESSEVLFLLRQGISAQTLADVKEDIKESRPFLYAYLVKKWKRLELERKAAADEDEQKDEMRNDFLSKCKYVPVSASDLNRLFSPVRGQNQSEKLNQNHQNSM